MSLEVATLGGGCFWCTQAIFSRLNGVVNVEAGYSGGELPNPTYEDVCTDKTGHAEVVQITFDPEIISYRQLLEVFFEVHDPTTPNRQGDDVGTQYRSIILYHDEVQKKIAEETIAQLEEQKRYGAPVVTEVVPFKAFYKAEPYHQGYYESNREKPYCKYVITPKVEKFMAHFSGLSRDRAQD
ncbi:MAG: peptide-methionine (S)-S-oxide reductase MsrA [Thermoprotei archaeon]